MALIQICLRGQSTDVALTHGGLCQILVWKRRTAQKGEMRGKVPLMILNQTQPFPVPRARAAQHSPYMVMVFA